MSAKNTLLLLIIAVVLAIAYFWYTKREESMVKEAEAPRREVIAGVTSNTLELIEIKTPDKTTVTLTRRDGEWYTDPAKNHKADKNLISGLFTPVEKKIEGDVVSVNPESFSEYQVDETSGTHVRMYGPERKVLADMFVGKAGGTMFSTYVRRAGENEVINADAALAFAFNKPEGWRDKTIVDMKSENAVAIASEGTSGTFTLRKDGDVWKVEQPVQRDAQNARVQTFMTTFANLRASDFAETTQSLAELGLDPPKQKITVTAAGVNGESTRTVVMLIGNQKEDAGPYYVKLPDSEQVYTIAEYQAKNLMPSVDEIAQQPPEPEPSTAETTASAEQTTPTEEQASPAADAATTSTPSLSTPLPDDPTTTGPANAALFEPNPATTAPASVSAPTMPAAGVTTAAQ